MHESVRHLRLDRRLLRRRGWLSSSDLDEAIAGLPDVSDKAQPPEEPSEARPAGDGSGESAEPDAG